MPCSFLKKYILTIFETNSLLFHSCRNKASQCIRSILHELTRSVVPNVDIRYLSATKYFVYHSWLSLLKWFTFLWCILLPILIHGAFWVATRCKAWVCSRPLAEIAGSNRAGGKDMSLVNVVRWRVEVTVTGYHSSRWILPSIVCLSVVVKPR